MKTIEGIYTNARIMTDDAQDYAIAQVKALCDNPVFEKENVLGGQIDLAVKPPHKDKLYWCIEDLVTACRKNGVQFKTGTAFTKELYSELKPYAVICATGGYASKPSFIDGYDRDNVYTTTDILTGKIKLENKKVAVVGNALCPTFISTPERVFVLLNVVTAFGCNQVAPTVIAHALVSVVNHATPGGVSSDAEKGIGVFSKGACAPAAFVDGLCHGEGSQNLIVNHVLSTHGAQGIEKIIDFFLRCRFNL